MYDRLPLTQRTAALYSGRNRLPTPSSQFYKKKEDLKEPLKTLRQINAEAPYNEEAGILNRATLPVIAAMRQQADEFLTTLRLFNSTNRPSKQRR
ncbi:hypothetical protein DFH28DRAFT_1131706 [Melampsora americana]|nr:hypothetical protein DFH28DRAFT_1131706 [Melampsora americana]